MTFKNWLVKFISMKNKYTLFVAPGQYGNYETNIFFAKKFPTDEIYEYQDIFGLGRKIKIIIFNPVGI